MVIFQTTTEKSAKAAKATIIIIANNNNYAGDKVNGHISTVCDCYQAGKLVAHNKNNS